MITRLAEVRWPRPLWALALALVFVPRTALPASIIDYGAAWRYYIGLSEASKPDAAAWRNVDFSDASWPQGIAPIGYSTNPNNPAEQSIATSLPSSGEAIYSSVFARHTFTLSNPSRAQELTLNVQIDDGFIAWLNGVEIARYNVPSGALTYDSFAVSALEPQIIQLVLSENVPQLLRQGANVLAIQFFNANFGSSDLVFDAALSSNLDESPPVVVGIDPSPSLTLPDLRAIEIVFNESVQNVNAADLLVNGVPATGYTAASPINYTFTFPQPPNGPVTVQWVTGHGITDLSANSFAGGSWNYTINTNIQNISSVVISEFLADNDTGIRDEDGTRSDWIELHNRGTTPTQLGGWFLTDDPLNLTKWQFPLTSLAANRYLLVWASSKNKTILGQPLHTNFRLSRDSGYLALVDSRTNIISEFNPYPAQRKDIAFGRDSVDPTLTGFFSSPTPGARNNPRGTGFAPDPVFSVDQGVFTNTSVNVAITASAGQIRYTLDGTVPTESSTAYAGPIAINTSTTIKARVFQTGLLPSAVVARNYMLVDPSVQNFTSNLPLLVFSTRQRSVADHPPQGSPGTFASVLAVDTFRGRSSVLSTPDFFGQGEISIRGQTSAGFPKKPYRVEFQDEYRNDTDVPLFGLPGDADWILNNPYSDKPFLQNFLAQEIFELMGHYAVRRKFVEVFVNTSGGRIQYPRDYVGVYLLLEKIEIGNDRVDLARLGPEDRTEPDITGGYIWKKDKDTAGDLDFYTPGGSGFSGQRLKLHEPKPTEITGEQLSWLEGHLNQFEQALYSSSWRTPGPNHYSNFIDVDSFVDHHWIVEFSKQIDGYRLSNYMHKDRGGKIKMAPIWDWNLSFGNADYLNGESTSGWYYQSIGENEHIWLRRLIAGSTSPSGTTGDPDFNQKIVDRWSVLRTNVTSSQRLMGRIDELAAMLNEPANRDFQKWPRLGSYVWPNPPIYSNPTTYSGIIQAFKTWISGRITWIDNQFVRIPRFTSEPGGLVPPGYNATLTAPAGSIYYTTDGSDPRLPGGAISPKAAVYSNPIPITQNSRIVARARNGVRWSGPLGGTFQVSAPVLALSEVMYHPAPAPAGSPFLDEDFEFLEFVNTSDAAINLAGYIISGGVDFTFSDLSLPAGERVLVVKNRAAFESRYGTQLRIAGEFVGNLSNQGERLLVRSALDELIADFTYSPFSHPVTDGNGFSLVRDNLQFPAAPATWRASSVFGGSPGQPDAAQGHHPSVVISEVLSRPALGDTDKIELQNLSNVPADISGWFLSDNDSEPFKYRFPNGTVIPPGAFLVVDGNQIAAADQPFGLSSLGEEIFLFSANAAGELTGYRHGFDFGAQAENGTFSRILDTLRREHFVPSATSTFGAPNSAPLIPAVVLSEIHYHPADVQANGQSWNNTEDEFIELFNRSRSPVNLHDATAGQSAWQLSGETTFVFPPNAVVPANGYALLVSFNPASSSAASAFRSRFNVPAEVPLLGPFAGQLNNAGGSVQLGFPTAPANAGDPAPLIFAERVDYLGNGPWPLGADGLGFSLSRRNADQFGNDPANWIAAAPSPGRAAPAPSAVVISEHPAGVFAASGTRVSLQVSATGTGPLQYRWRFNGDILGNASQPTLVIANAQPVNSGLYEAIVSDSSGAVSSAPARVTIFSDADSDGIADEWEFAFGFDPFSSTGAATDPDADGHTTSQEFIAGTNPLDPASVLAFDNLLPADGTPITFLGHATRTYSIEYTDSLQSPEWKLLQRVAPLSTGLVTVQDPFPTPNRFYRLLTP